MPRRRPGLSATAYRLSIRFCQDVGETFSSPTMRTLKRILPLTAALLAVSMPTQAIEEPVYDLYAKYGAVEFRQYSPYVVAEVVVDGPASEAGNKAFSILAGYIFGKNKGAKTFAMTAPVTQTTVPRKLAMTAPVTQSIAPGGHLVQFVLPRGTTLDAAPEPIDTRITVRQEPSKRVAVIRYSGFWSDANYHKHLSQLEDSLRKAGVKWTGEPVYSRYNAPFTPWFMRRNEIWLPLPSTTTGSSALPESQQDSGFAAAAR